jgi:acyl-CoA thioester hydrolase
MNAYCNSERLSLPKLLESINAPETESHPVQDDQTLKDVFAGFPVVIFQPVQWGEQDAFGHVNHVTYFRWYETARIAYFLKVGLMDMHKQERIGPILASVANDYRRQLTYPDTVHIGARITRIGRSSMHMEHKIFSQNDQALAAEGTSAVVILDYQTNKSHAVRMTWCVKASTRILPKNGWAWLYRLEFWPTRSASSSGVDLPISKEVGATFSGE